MARYYRRDWRGRFARGGGSGRPMGGRGGTIRPVGGAKVNAVTRRGATRYRGGSAIGGNKRRRFVSTADAVQGATPGALRLAMPAGNITTVIGRASSYRGARRIAKGKKSGSGYIVTADR